MTINENKRWFKLPGVATAADRTLKEQMAGLEHALAEASGKTVLDIGCAEALISLEFAKAGASRVLGVEALEYHLKVARDVCAGRAVSFVCKKVEDCAPEEFEPHDIVLALSVLHKVRGIDRGLRLIAGWTRGLLVVRYPQWYNRRNRVLTSKRDTTDSVDVPHVLGELGFKRERWIDSPPRHEPLEYWRKV